MRDAPVAVALADLFKCLGHPVRIRVCEVLIGGERSAGDLAEQIGVEFSHLSQQLAVLRRAQVVTTRRAGTSVFYSLRDPRMSQLLVVAKQLLVTGLRDNATLLADLEQAGRADETSPTAS